jgi:hypothetical protein
MTHKAKAKMPFDHACFGPVETMGAWRVRCDAASAILELLMQ